MRVQKKTPSHYIINGQRICDQFLNTLPTNIQHVWNQFMTKLIKVKGVADPHMPWSKFNTRYGAEKSVSGVLGELIAIKSAMQYDSSTSFSIYDTIEDQTNGLDFINSESGINYQVKTIRTINNKIPLDILDCDLGNPVADYLTLVDIDDHTVYNIAKEEFVLYTKHAPVVSFNNPKLYGYYFTGWNCDVADIQHISTLPTSTHDYYIKPDITTITPQDIAALWC